jgi:competence protein ComEC
VIKEIQKRPFLRPLIIWITGIILQTCGSFRLFSFGLLFVPAMLLLAPTGLKKKPELNYKGRWNWGLAFICLLLFLSIQMTAYHESRISDPNPSLLQQWAGHARKQLLAPLEHLRLTDTERSVLATITLGDGGEMSKTVIQQFADTGVVHILSVSGFHVAIVCGFLMRILSVLSVSVTGRWIRYFLALLLLWIFTAISGLAAASVRAAIMLTLYLTGKQLSRATDGYNTVSASAFCMLVYNPFYLYDIGFQLSYTAVVFILYLQPRLNRLIRVKNPILKTPWEWITLTLAAQTGAAFLCLFYFGQFPSVFLFTNLPLSLIATLLIPLALLWMLAPAEFPGLDMLQPVLEMLTRAMMWIVDTFSRMPAGTLPLRFSFVMMLLSYAALFFLFLYNEKRRPRLLLVSLFLILFIIIQKGIYLFL